jgi:glycosyltransferase involved in cell wall biosynthesis
MKVLIVHNRYQQPGGEETAVANEQALLDAHGWQTCLWCVANDRIARPRDKLAVAVRTAYSRPARRQMALAIAESAPDVVHVHNFFPLLSPSIYDAARAAGVATVQTLHNYRTICAQAALSRDDRPCEDCIRGSPYRAVLHGCYRGSRIGSLAVAKMISTHRRRGTWVHKIDRFIALSNFAKSKFVNAGFPAERIDVKPNFAEDLGVDAPSERAGALYVGRLGFEKGIGTMLRAWRGLDLPLRIVGDGPLSELVANTDVANVKGLGHRPPAEVRAEMAKAAFLVLPSQVYENFPITIAEAFCQGLPVIASRIGALAEIIEEGSTGLLFSPGDADDLRSKAHWARQHPTAMRLMGDNARRVYQTRYSPAVNFAQLTTIYKAATEQSRLRRPR